MNQAKFMCKMCGHVTQDKTKPHHCGSVTAVIHKEEEFIPRSAVDELVGSCVTGIKKNLSHFCESHPQELNTIHPKMLLTLIITNITLNMFLDGFTPKATFKETREALNNFMDGVTTMVKEGINALYATTADTTNPH